MNLNMNLDLKSLKLNPATVLPVLKKLQPLIVGGALIGVFGYTAYTINAAVNVAPAEVEDKALGIRFDQTTLDSLKNLNNVPGTVAPVAVGKSDPFGNN